MAVKHNPTRRNGFSLPEREIDGSETQQDPYVWVGTGKARRLRESRTLFANGPFRFVVLGNRNAKTDASHARSTSESPGSCRKPRASVKRLATWNLPHCGFCRACSKSHVIAFVFIRLVVALYVVRRADVDFDQLRLKIQPRQPL